MKWQVQEAKARFSEFLDATLKKGPQIVTRRGVETAVLVPIEEWKRVQSGAPTTLKDWLLAPKPPFEVEVPERGKSRRRPTVEFE
ncbi:type II toxin-antitoxin system Phd/YefM family antitoxin [Acidobacterium sp. S8]|jgi:prevent-host-death family protein|uniref:type II toxin-antitoxin system Phd/YefM family antitoxin n=1 Tax=Acidobacterium sp. S8 TaxID=1641854 RepID=UPI00131AEC93|nr:type II toxin-antitoxin system Phd/YefM family antitoxin [Acidobacterium sp. S8]